MSDDDRNATMLPLSRVPAETLRDELTPDAVVRSSRIQGLADELTGLLPVMLEVLPSPVLVIDERHRLVVANAGARRLLSEGEIQFVGYSVGRFLSLEKLEEARIKLLSRAGVHSYRDTILVGGIEREVDIHIEYLETAGREFLVATLSDETHNDRERAEWTDSQPGSAPPSARIDHAHRLEALGHLTGRLAHDFNNLLSVITGSLESAERRIAKGRDPLPDIQRAMTAAQRSRQTTSEILRYARNRPPELKPISPEVLLLELRGLIERALGDSIRLVFELSTTADVRVGPAQLETALLNLVINARDAVEDGGEIRVALCRRTLSDDEAVSLGLLEGEHVSIKVIDSGQGMTEEVKKRVFEPFYTTKPQGRGTGLGLSTVRSVAQKYGGTVILDSSVGRGTRVELLFPAA